MTDQTAEAPRPAPEVRIADIVLPNQTNNHGTMFGGDVLALMDRAAGIAALRFCRQPVVTASTERIDFRTPIQRGEIIEAIAKVVYVGRTSMIVRIHIYAEHPLIGDRRICTTGYFSMVALNQAGQPVPVPRLLLDDDESRAEWAVGEEVRRSIDARRT
ncbi:MAG TPA: acyl-CoA thioesterase [Roseiflexaceae bacterium]